MEYMTINNRRVPIEGEKNVLAVIRKIGIDIPTFCYHSELSIYGACRMCVVEDENGNIFASCAEKPKEGMSIFTNTLRVQKHRKMIVEMILASHCRDCTSCEKNGRCTLQELAARLGVKDVRFENINPVYELDESSPSITRDPNKCILCGDCVRTCAEIQGLGVYEFVNKGSDIRITTKGDKKQIDTDCVGCGQCRTVCPTGAITIKNDTEQVWEYISDKNTRVIAQIAPAVRIAVGDKFGIPKGSNSMGKLVAALRKIGFDEVYDTVFGADLTVMEESAELLKRLETGENLPLFTSCCPGWVNFCEKKYPDLLPHLSSCRSPQGMFSAVAKEYYRQEENNDGRKTVMVSIMPCTAKKGEITKEGCFTDGEQDTDVVLTTTEVVFMIKEAGIALDLLEDETTDMPFGLVSGGGTIFGVTGGVTEAVLRRLANKYSREALEDIEYSGVRGIEGIKQANIMLGDREVKIAVVNGLKNASLLLNKIKAGKAEFDFVEVMACRRGCVMGGGQPTPAGPRTKKARAQGLYNADIACQIKRSNDNPMVTMVYEKVIKENAHKLLHTR